MRYAEVGLVVWPEEVFGVIRKINAEENEEGYLLIEFRPKEYKYGLSLDRTLNRRDMRSNFGYRTLYEIHVFLLGYRPCS